MKRQRKGKRASAVIFSLIFSVCLSMAVAGYLNLVMNEYRIAKRYTNMVTAFYLGEAGTEYGMYRLEQVNISSRTTLTYNLDGFPVVVVIDPDDPNNPHDGNTGDELYTVSGTGSITDHIGIVNQTVTTTVHKNPPSKVFDYVYFINNWGWFYGSGITAKGDVRSNGIFSFRQGPRVNGNIYGGDMIDVDGSGIKGYGGNEDYQHAYSDRVTMPNLIDLNYYRDLAVSEAGSITRAGVTLVDQIQGDDVGENENIILVGTPNQPIVIDGPVVIEGDVIIKGTVKGQGTIYSGRNIYLADDIKYKNAPPSPRPANDNPETVDNWVNAHQDKDLVGFAARESIIMGDFTASGWYAQWWLFDMGDEDVGQDGIPDTDDDGEEDGIFEPEYEDLDEDGQRDYNYDWNSIVPQVALNEFDNLPAGVNSYSDLSSNYINRLDGVFYTNHAFAGRTGNGVQINGAIISKDEAIIYRNTITMNYDERIHSRYRQDPNWLINLNLPIADDIQVLLWRGE